MSKTCRTRFYIDKKWKQESLGVVLFCALPQKGPFAPPPHGWCIYTIYTIDTIQYIYHICIYTVYIHCIYSVYRGKLGVSNNKVPPPDPPPPCGVSLPHRRCILLLEPRNSSWRWAHSSLAVFCSLLEISFAAHSFRWVLYYFISWACGGKSWAKEKKANSFCFTFFALF